MNVVGFCPKCKGTGTIPQGDGSVPCNRCGGDGQIPQGLVDSDTLQKDVATGLEYLKKIMEKLEVKPD